ncbi:MAG: nuclear transport factor 2 family protein [Actinomycetota bacterium]|nr:nuclear transport factor 2 family protein [Actinomycetota bacterium]
MAARYVGAFRDGDLDDADVLLSPDMIRVAPMETDGEPVEREGLDEIMENAAALTGDYDLHRVDIGGPFMAADQFAVRFTFDGTHVPTGVRSTTSKMSLYTVADGRITREEVYYFDAPQEKTA